MADADEALKQIRVAAAAKAKKREKDSLNVTFEETSPPEAEVLRVWRELKVPGCLQQTLAVAGYDTVGSVSFIVGDKNDTEGGKYLLKR